MLPRPSPLAPFLITTDALLVYAPYALCKRNLAGCAPGREIETSAGFKDS